MRIKSLFLVLFGVLSVFGSEVDLDSKLNEFVALKVISKKYYYQVGLPKDLKLIWDSVLSKSNLSIHNLTESLKIQNGFRSTTLGFAGTESRSFKIREREGSRGFGHDLDQAVELLKINRPDLFKTNHIIFVEENSVIQGRQSPLLILHHELAHIYFTDFLNANLSKMVGKFPSDLLFFDESKNSLVIDSQLLSYLQERFAHESEFRLFLELKKNRQWLPIIPPKWLQLQNYTFSSVAQKQIAVMIRQVYNLDDVRLSFLDSTSVLDLVF